MDIAQLVIQQTNVSYVHVYGVVTVCVHLKNPSEQGKKNSLKTNAYMYL